MQIFTVDGKKRKNGAIFLDAVKAFSLEGAITEQYNIPISALIGQMLGTPAVL